MHKNYHSTQIPHAVQTWTHCTALSAECVLLYVHQHHIMYNHSVMATHGTLRWS